MGIATSDVAIIGAGLAGIALALALDQDKMPCRIYESRSSDAPELGSGIILTPNGLAVLDAIGVFERIRARCWKSEFRTFKNDKDETTRKTVIANEELYGYKNHRLYRQQLLDEMKLMLAEQNIQIEYDAKFDGVISDTQEQVAFSINGQTRHASLLIGSDGIYSTVRKHLDPDASPEYTGTMGVLSHINRNTVKWPYEDFEKACTIQGKPGAIFFIPEVADGSEIMVGKQAQQPDIGRAGWEAMAADKEKLCDFYRDGYDEWHDTAKSIIDSVCAHKETLYLWAFLKMPKLERWSSETGRVVIVGDAAHAIPPSSGQGANQALEDVYSLALILKSHKNLHAALKYWQDRRQARIDTVYDWATNNTNVERMSEAERNKLIQEGKVQRQDNSKGSDDMSWLYRLNIDEYVMAA